MVSLNIILLLVLVVLGCSLIEGKEFNYKKYRNSDCTGDVLVYRSLQASSTSYCFQFLQDLLIDCSDGKSCLVSQNCSCTNSTCGQVYELDQCIDGVKIGYNKIDFYELRYCVFSESRTLDYCSTKPNGAVIVKNNECFGNVRVSCDYHFYKFRTCDQDNKLIKKVATMYCDFYEIPNNNNQTIVSNSSSEDQEVSLLQFMTEDTYFTGRSLPTNSSLRSHSCNLILSITFILLLTLFNFY
ncbi:hypothetical protein CYY_000991 [Polysphondylium violaceum]|uniref:Transmembrane protein n=1 Tax=Polysphondylium violaceum TaxID=133409 RepID=A0A8J4Q1R7_9MYCE|nr:hypothetical protein CYY_000991 [Polysphondylium violaceum]